MTTLIEREQMIEPERLGEVVALDGKNHIASSVPQTRAHLCRESMHGVAVIEIVDHHPRPILLEISGVKPPNESKRALNLAHSSGV